MLGRENLTADVRRRVVTHKSGFVTFMSKDTGEWQVRRSNAEAWVNADFATRRAMVPKMLRMALDVYICATKSS